MIKFKGIVRENTRTRQKYINIRQEVLDLAEVDKEYEIIMRKV